MDALLLLRVHDRPGAIERVLGAIRRKTLAVRRLSLHAPTDGMHEVVLRFDTERTPEARIVAELGGLYDVHELRPLDATDLHTREMAVAHVRGDTPAQDAGRIVGRWLEGVVVEVTGTPAEVDTVLDRLRATGSLAAAVRTGEVVVPITDPSTQGSAEKAPPHSGEEEA